MKPVIHYLIIATLLISFSAEAQTSDQIEKAAKNTTSATSGAQEDVLSDYLQVAAKSITNSSSGLQIKLNWFSLNTDPNRYANTNYYKSYWQHRGEFVGFAGTKSWQIGLNYNLLDHRDTTMHRYQVAYQSYDRNESAITISTNAKFKAQIEPNVNAILTQIVTDAYTAGAPINDLAKRIDDKLPGILQGLTSDDGNVGLLQTALNTAIGSHAGVKTPSVVSAIDYLSSSLVTEAISTIIASYAAGTLKGNAFNSFISDLQIAAIKSEADQQVKNDPLLNKTLGASTLPEVEQKIQANYDQQIAFVARQPLLTFGYLYNGVTGTGAPYHQAGLTYLMSFGNAQSTHIGQLKASLTDTLGSTDPAGKVKNFNRNILAFQAGYNQVLIVHNKTSLAEINGALEEDMATSGYVSKTNTSKFYLDAYIRARLPSTPWLKLDLKYDPKGGNVFGLLDFTYNFGQ